MKMTSPFQKYFLSVSSLTVNKQTKKLNKKKKHSGTDHAHFQD